MRQIAIIAGKELRDGFRNRWVVATAALLAALALTLAFLGAAPTGSVKVSELGVTIVSLSSLTIFLVPLIALLLSYDAIVGEVGTWHDGPVVDLSGGALAGDSGQVHWTSGGLGLRDMRRLRGRRGCPFFCRRRGWSARGRPSSR